MSSIRTLSKMPSGFEDENARYPLVPLAILRRLRWNSDSVDVALNCSDIWDVQFFFLSFFGLLSYVTYIHTCITFILTRILVQLYYIAKIFEGKIKISKTG